MVPFSTGREGINDDDDDDDDDDNGHVYGGA